MVRWVNAVYLFVTYLVFDYRYLAIVYKAEIDDPTHSAVVVERTVTLLYYRQLGSIYKSTVGYLLICQSILCAVKVTRKYNNVILVNLGDCIEKSICLLFTRDVVCMFKVSVYVYEDLSVAVALENCIG